ncbi:odorant receptor 94b-like isoform X1 [Choristoneura fumiferana]|uniref:odorant receptor 94b-like isoform X1 n=2 Tax=Choristoneura fumiferana TaxID=7141 RepID=UPI003D154E05
MSSSPIDGVSPAGACVAPLLRTLQRCGFFRLPPNAAHASISKRVAHKLHDAYCGFALVVTSAYLGQQLIYAYQERGDMERFSRVMFLLLCHVTSIAKQVVFLVRAPRITALLEGLNDAAYNPSESKRATLLLERVRGARRLGAVYAGTAAATCALWTLFPLLTRLHGGSVHFAFWIPLEYNGTWLKFSVVLLYTHYVTTLVGVANTTMDAFIATVLGQCKTQLTILKMDFESLGERAAERARATGERRGAAAAALLVHCVTHHHKICHTSRELQAVFGGCVLLQFGIGGWILCMAAFKLVGMNMGSLEFISILMFLMCILTELFLYCYYGNEVAVESTQVPDAVYGMRWPEGEVNGVGRRVRRALPFVLCCCAGAARRPLRPAALFIPLSLETFVTIIKSSYTFYAMLRQTQH